WTCAWRMPCRERAFPARLWMTTGPTSTGGRRCLSIAIPRQTRSTTSSIWQRACSRLGWSSRSPVLCIPDQGCSIAHHETQGTEVLPELSALADEVGRPRGACEGARGHRRSSPGATRRGEEGFLDLVQAAVLRHRQAA